MNTNLEKNAAESTEDLIHLFDEMNDIELEKRISKEPSPGPGAGSVC